MQKLAKMLFVGALLATVAGCSYLKFPGVYRISVQQGNIVDKDMLDKLELGMTRRQVRFVMGTPLLEDTFNPDRWDYYYSLRTGDGKLVSKHLTLRFDGEILAAIDGDTTSGTPLLSPEEARKELGQDGPEVPAEPFEDLIEQ